MSPPYPLSVPGSDGPDLCKPHHLPILIDPIQTLPMKLNKTKSGDPDNVRWYISFCLFWQEEVQLEKSSLSLSLEITVTKLLHKECLAINNDYIILKYLQVSIIYVV